MFISEGEFEPTGSNFWTMSLYIQEHKLAHYVLTL